MEQAWNLRYASHLGYREPETPLFRASVGSSDLVRHVEYAAELGFAGVQFARAVTHSRDERARVRRAMERLGLEMGCMVYAGREIVLAPLWGTLDESARATREAALHAAFDVADELNARQIIVFSAADPRLPLAIQHAAFIDNLKRAAELAAARGKVLCLENMSRKSRSGTLVSHFGEAFAIARAVASPAVRIVFDTSHVQVMDGDLIDTLRATWDAIEIVQLADNPGRYEPGSGEINFENILRVVHELRYRGLIEMEHEWSEPGAAAEARSIGYLRALDARLADQPRPADRNYAG